MTRGGHVEPAPALRASRGGEISSRRATCGGRAGVFLLGRPMVPAPHEPGAPAHKGASRYLGGDEDTSRSGASSSASRLRVLRPGRLLRGRSRAAPVGTRPPRRRRRRLQSRRGEEARVNQRPLARALDRAAAPVSHRRASHPTRSSCPPTPRARPPPPPRGPPRPGRWSRRPRMRISTRRCSCPTTRARSWRTSTRRTTRRCPTRTTTSSTPRRRTWRTETRDGRGGGPGRPDDADRRRRRTAPRVRDALVPDAAATFATGGGDDVAFLHRLNLEGNTLTTSAPLTGHADSVSDVRFNRDGTLLATAGLDGPSLIWRASDGGGPHVCRPPVGGPRWVRWPLPKGDGQVASCGRILQRRGCGTERRRADAGVAGRRAG